MRQEAADAILARLGEFGWGKGRDGLYGDGLSTVTGPICLDQAIAKACQPFHIYQQTSSEVFAQVAVLYPDRVVEETWRGVPAFNDHADTTFEDVLLVVKHAISEGEEG